MEEKKTSGQQKENKLVKIIIAVLVVIIILLLLRSCAKRASLTVKLSEGEFYSDDITTDVIDNIISVDNYTLNHDGEVYISDSKVIYREGGYTFEFIAEYGDVIIAVTDGNKSGQADCLVMKGVDWHLTGDEGEDTIEVKELYYSGSKPTSTEPTSTDSGDDTPSAPVTPTTPSNPTDGDDSGSGDSDQPASKPEQVELGGSLNGDHQVIVGGDDQPSGGSGSGTGNGGSDNGSNGSGNNGGTVVTIPDEDVTGTIPGENNISKNPNLSHEETSLGDRVVSKPTPSTPAPADTPAAPTDNGGSNNTSTDAGKPADGGASKPAPAPTPQPQPENPPVVVEAPAPADPAPADNTPAPSTDPNIICDENGDCKIIW